METETIILLIFFGLLVCAIISVPIWFIYFSSRVEQIIEKFRSDSLIMTNKDSNMLVITTKVFYYDKVIKTFTTECDFNDAEFDNKAKKDMELAKIYLNRYKTYGTNPLKNENI